MDLVIESIQEEWQYLIVLTPRLIAALTILGISILVGKIVGKSLIPVLTRHSVLSLHADFFNRLIFWGFFFLGTIIGLNIVKLQWIAASLVAGGGITAIVLGFAFREIGENFLAGFFLAFSRPFKIGDTIQSGDYQGRVENIELRYTHIRTNDGRDIFIPSAQIFNGVLVNYTRDGYRRPSFTVGIDYADDADKACSVILEAVKAVEGVLSSPSPEAVISELTPQYVEIRVHFGIDTFQAGVNMRQVQHQAMNTCRLALLEQGFTVSSDTVASLAVGDRGPIRIRLDQNADGDEND